MLKFYTKVVFFILLIIINGCNTKKIPHKSVIGFSQYTTNDAWHKAMIQSMKVESQFYNNIELIVLDGKGSVDNQIEDIENLIEKKVDILIVSPIAPKPLKAIINKAIEANIPIIILDREIKDVNYHAFIGPDNYEIGVNVAKHITSLKTKADIIEIKGWAGTSPTIQRSAGFKNTITNNSNIKIIATTQERYNEPGIKKYFKEILLKKQETNFIFAHTDALGLEAYEAAKELGIEKKIQFIGVGGVNSKNGGIPLIEKKILQASILQPTGGKEAIQTAVKIINNEKVTRNNLLPSLVIDINNVDVIKRQSELILNQEQDIEKQQAKIKDQFQIYSSQKKFLFYTLLLMGLIVILLLFTFIAKRKLSKQKVLLEDYINQIASQKNKLEKSSKELAILNESTNNFFTGVSHDFKTPISLILSSVESLLTENKGVKPKEYGFIYNNSKRLLRMINELLNFKRLENKKIRIQAVKTNIYHFTETIFNDFKKEAEKRDINFKLTNKISNPEVYIDNSLFDNILFNLLSNAFKFTTNKGKIEIILKEDHNSVFISIHDTGIGILDTEKDKIFDQFFQGSNNKQTSSGIGLYLTKEYLKQHKGDIEVISSNGKGSEFKLHIPKGKNHFKPEDIFIDNNITNNKDNINIDSFSFEENGTTGFKNDTEKETLLIIEDNTDLREFLKNKLSKKYNIEESDGINAIKKATDTIPDIIISDVNLPEKNGFEITKALKEDERTSHIPIIILTALSSSEAHLKGLQNGVDMFLTKPFNLAILNQSLKTLSYNRKKLQLFHQQNLTTTIGIIEEVKKDTNSAKKEKRNDLDKVFFSKINAIILKNIDDSSFTVEFLAEEMNISRVQLYRKTKAVLGISISDYIQNLKLEKSKELLLDENLTISDVAYSSGFSSPNYFSTSFKNKYGKTPNQFKKQQKSSKTK